MFGGIGGPMYGGYGGPMYGGYGGYGGPMYGGYGGSMYDYSDSSDQLVMGQVCIYYGCVTISGVVLFAGIWFRSSVFSRRPRRRYPIWQFPLYAHGPENGETNYLCNSYYRNLDNAEIQDNINFTAGDECFVADNIVRFRPSSKSKVWRRRELMTNGSLPFEYKNCYSIRLPEYGTASVVSTNNCGFTNERSLLFLIDEDNELCRRRQFKCVEVFKSTSGNIRRQSKKLLPSGNYRSLRNTGKMPVAYSIVEVVVKNEFIFKYGVKSNRLAVIDPDYDCIAFAVKKNKIVSRDCEDKDCSSCIT